MSITLYPKKSINFLTKFRSHKYGEINMHHIKNVTIWSINNFLTNDECLEIISNSENAKFDDKFHGLLSYDKNGILLKTIQQRLKGDILNNLNNYNWVQPYGFTHGIKWDKNTEIINECIRIKKYKGKIGWHRDIQYSKSSLLRSNYTALIYLNDCPDSEIIFRIPKVQPEYTGLTIDQEIKFINDKGFKNIIIKPKTGRLVLFDQRLIHCSRGFNTEQYVLRTDLLCSGKYTDKSEASIIYKKTEELAKKLFDYAQLTRPKNNKLYERCISLCQEPHKITQFPIALQVLFK